MLTNYLDQAAMVSLVKSLAGLTVADSVIIMSLQDNSASHPNYPGQPVYRPYLAAALLLSRDTAMKIKKADGVEFKDWTNVVLSLLYQQQAFDIAYGLSLLPGTSINDYLAILGLNTAETKKKKVKRFGSLYMPLEVKW